MKGERNPAANRLREQRQSRRLTTAALARMASVHINTIYGIEARGVIPTPLVAASLAAALDCEVDDLFDVVLNQGRRSQHAKKTPPPAIPKVSRPAATCSANGCNANTRAAYCPEHQRIAENWPLPPVEPTGSPRWRQQAACVDVSTDVFYPGEGVLPSLEVFQACSACPVRGDCLSACNPLDDGIWGGMSAGQRRELRGRRVLA